MSVWYCSKRSAARRSLFMLEAPCLGAVEQGTTEDAGARHGRRTRRVQQRDERAPPGVVAGVRTRRCDAAAELERPARVVEERLARRRRAEPRRVRALVVANDGDALQARRRLPQGASLPAVGDTGRLEEHHEGFWPRPRAGEQLG